MVSALGKSFQGVQPEMDWIWKPGYVFVVKYICDLCDVKVNMEKGLLGYNIYNHMEDSAQESYYWQNVFILAPLHPLLVVPHAPDQRATDTVGWRLRDQLLLVVRAEKNQVKKKNIQLYVGHLNMISNIRPQWKKWAEFLHNNARTPLVFRSAQVDSNAGSRGLTIHTPLK